MRKLNYVGQWVWQERNKYYLLTKYLYPILAIAVAPGVTNVMHAVKYVNVDSATP
jgi:hypothetical protein